MTPLTWLELLGCLPEEMLLETGGFSADLCLVGWDLTAWLTAWEGFRRGLRGLIVLPEDRLKETGESDFVVSESRCGVITPLLACISQSESDLTRLMACRDWWARQSLQPGFETSWKVTGSIYWPRSQNELDRGIALVEELGCPGHLIDRDQILSFTQGDEATSGIHFPSDAVIDVKKTIVSIAQTVRGSCRIIRVRDLDDPLYSSGIPLVVSERTMNPWRTEWTSDRRLALPVSSRVGQVALPTGDGGSLEMVATSDELFPMLNLEFGPGKVGYSSGGPWDHLLAPMLAREGIERLFGTR